MLTGDGSHHCGEDAATNDEILSRLCADLAWKITGGPDRPSAESVAAQIKSLATQWADGQRECDALAAEEHSAVAAMAIRGQMWGGAA